MKLHLCLVAGALGLCSLASPSLAAPSNDALPDVAAEYSTEVSIDGAKQVQHWKFWREGGRVQRQSSEFGLTDVWQRDGKSILHLKLFSAERRGIEFQNEDLQLLHAHSPWTEIQRMVPRQVTEALGSTEAIVHEGVPQTSFSGMLDGVQWTVVWRDDLALPSRIEKRTGPRTETVILQNASSIDQASWRPESPADYSIMDFADLGDHEHDPFVQRVQSLFGAAHRH